ncbi:MAG: fatty acid desaturase [Candidatus Omnitrophica bacterium]|nr:fatty acid desaturase [Candidatus Omnitrophota bacterium]
MSTTLANPELQAVEQDLDRQAAAGLIKPRLKIKWDIAVGIAIIHLGALLALSPSMFTWKAFWTFFVLQWLTGGVGITLAFHRLLTHRSFRVPKWLEYAVTFLGSLALQGGPLKWVATHRVHHAFSDRPEDPHSPTRGFWWAHVLWLFAYDDVLDHPVKHLRYVPELARDPVHRWINDTHVWHTVGLGALFYVFGGWPCVVWGIFVRLVLVYHSTWLVNSAAHIWGYRTYKTNEGSTNNWWVAALTYGEGWHNNHHAYPHSAVHGLRWWEVDLTYATIRLLAVAGLAHDIRLPRGNPAKLTPLSGTISIRRFRWPVSTVSA